MAFKCRGRMVAALFVECHPVTPRVGSICKTFFTWQYHAEVRQKIYTLLIQKMTSVRTLVIRSWILIENGRGRSLGS